MSDTRDRTVGHHDHTLDSLRVELSQDVLALTEVLARHVHDTWMRVRLAQGWTLGPRRDDVRKQHPCLVPYEQLPEAEKECDRQTTLATLRAMKALGFEIIKRDR